MNRRIGMAGSFLSTWLVRGSSRDDAVSTCVANAAKQHSFGQKNVRLVPDPPLESEFAGCAATLLWITAKNGHAEYNVALTSFNPEANFPALLVGG